MRHKEIGKYGPYREKQQLIKTVFEEDWALETLKKKLKVNCWISYYKYVQWTEEIMSEEVQKKMRTLRLTK